MLAEVRQSEGDVPRFILRGQPCHRGGNRIWSVDAAGWKQIEELFEAVQQQPVSRRPVFYEYVAVCAPPVVDVNVRDYT